eukprot:24991_1
MYEDILLKYTQTYEECNKYQKLATKYQQLYDDIQFNCNAPDLPYENNFVNNVNKDTDYKFQYDDLQRKYEKLESEICQLKNEKCEYIKLISQLKKDLSSAQHNILEMTNIVGVQQALPTIQETVSQFYNIRDQYHHNTCSKLKQYIQIKFKENKYQKYYINQIIHKFMFNTLLKCNLEVVKYKSNMFNKISTQLNMDYTLKQVYYYNNNESSLLCDDNKCVNIECDNNFIYDEKYKILENRFASYFRDNYKYVLKTDLLKRNVINDMLNEFEHFRDLKKDNNKYNICDCYQEYVLQCIDICWIMLLQDPKLKLTPLEWRPNSMKIYDDKCSKRILGSDRKCNNILYYVWPNLMRDGNKLNNQKVEVVTQNELYKPRKF